VDRNAFRNSKHAGRRQRRENAALGAITTTLNRKTDEQTCAEHSIPSIGVEHTDVTGTKMSERKTTVAALLIASMVIGCSPERNIGQAAQTARQPHAGMIDLFVPHISTERANEGSRVSLFVRERRGAPKGPVVLFVQGRSAAAVPSFDLEYRDYSWMVYLADAGFDVFALDLQGYGSSSKPRSWTTPATPP
jgi:hypothetical protein